MKSIIVHKSIATQEAEIISVNGRVYVLPQGTVHVINNKPDPFVSEEALASFLYASATIVIDKRSKSIVKSREF
jgi:hypothetical protein